MAVERALPTDESWAFAHADHLSRYLFAAPYVNGKSVLDAGCGPGYGSALLSELGASRVVGVDIDGDTIAGAVKIYASSSTEFRIDDCEQLETVRDKFDVVCNFENIEHLHNPERFLRRVTEVIAQGGKFLCSSPDLRGPYKKLENGRTDNPYHINEWSVDEFEKLLSRFFERVEMHQQVQSFATFQRRKAASQLKDFLAQLWSSPWRRALRGLNRLAGRQYKWPAVLELANPSPADYPIVTSKIAGLFGVPYCHVAVCSEPKRLT